MSYLWFKHHHQSSPILAIQTALKFLCVACFGTCVMKVNWVLEMLMCIPCNITTVCFCWVCKEVKLCYSFGECRFEEQREGYFRKLRKLRNQEEFENKKTLRKKKKASLGQLSGYVCQGKKDKCRKTAVTEIVSWDITKSGFRWLWKEVFT